ncbi:MAG: penicillin acylase family protein, partial [Bacteroidota bacterium]
MKKFLGFLVAIILLLVGGLSIYLTQVNKFKRDGELGLACLDQPVTVKRDEHGIPYIFAESLSDLIKAQGFVLGQDRIFQIELYRLMIQGRLTEAVGAVAKDADIRMQVMGVYANARRHEAYLNESSRQYLQWFADGYNEFVATQEDDFPLELSLLGITPSPLFITDMLAIHHYVGFTHSQNMGDEILSLLLADALGPDKASEFFPLNINPDREQAVMDLWRQTDSLSPVTAMHAAGVSFADPNPISPLAMGSNNWVINADKAAGSKPILCNDPHLDARILPGPWYPIGLFCPEVQAVGGAIPGIPGILVGRTDKVAFGVTNAYGDNQDLYLETPDPANEGHYLEGDTSLAFSTRETQLMIKDDEEAAGFRIENLTIRSSSRGPVISDHKVFGLSPDQPVVLRWTQAEVQSENIGFDRLFLARNAQDVEAALAQVEVVYMNFVFADQEGNIGHRSTGQIPIRKNKQGALPKEGKEGSDWV